CPAADVVPIRSNAEVDEERGREHARVTDDRSLCKADFVDEGDRENEHPRDDEAGDEAEGENDLPHGGMVGVRGRLTATGYPSPQFATIARRDDFARITLSGDDTSLFRELHGLGAPPGAQLGKEVRRVCLHGILAHEEALGDLAIA